MSDKHMVKLREKNNKKLFHKAWHDARLGLLILFLILAISACQTNQVNRETSPSLDLETSSFIGIDHTPSGTAAPPTPKTTEPQEINETGVYEVHNYDEFLNSIGNNREIRLMPGNYDPVSVNEDQKTFESIENLTLIGVPENGQQYIRFITSSGFNNVLTFSNCNGIVLKNMDIGHTEQVECYGNVLVFSDSKNIMIENCRLFGCGQEGLVLVDVENLNMKQSLIEDCSQASLTVTGKSRNINFLECTLKDKDLNVWNYGEGVTFDKCKILSQSGTLSTMDETYPISYSTGYESDWGTEDWNTGQSLFAIYYNNLNKYTAKYINTYDGNEAFFTDSRFMKLVDTVRSISSSIVLSVDQEQNISSKLTLKIHFMDGSENDTIDVFINHILALKPTIDALRDMNLPVMLILHDKNDPFKKIAAIRFTIDNFVKLLSGSTSNLNDATEVLLLSNGASFTFFTRVDDTLIRDGLKNFISTNYPLGEPTEGQSINYLLSTWQNGQVWDYYSIESFAGMGDFMHYSSDLIFKIDAKTGDIYLVDQDGLYTLASQENVDTITSCINQMDETLKDKLDGYVSLVVPLAQINAVDNSFYHVYVLTINKLDPERNNDMEYEYHHYILTIDLLNNRVVDTQPYHRVEYSDMYKQDSSLFSATASIIP